MAVAKRDNIQIHVAEIQGIVPVSNLSDAWLISSSSHSMSSPATFQYIPFYCFGWPELLSVVCTNDLWLILINQGLHTHGVIWEREHLRMRRWTSKPLQLAKYKSMGSRIEEGHKKKGEGKRHCEITKFFDKLYIRKRTVEDNSKFPSLSWKMKTGE